jgi:hypothetical protein
MAKPAANTSAGHDHKLHLSRWDPIVLSISKPKPAVADLLRRKRDVENQELKDSHVTHTPSSLLLGFRASRAFTTSSRET